MKSITIGRDSSNQYIIYDNTNAASRHHAVLKVHEDNKVFIQDKSSNGTFVNGQEIPKHVDKLIKWGDKVSFANIADLDWNKISSIVESNINTYTVGTQAGNTIEVFDSTGEVSRNHAIIEVHENGNIFLTDISSNGTWVSGRKIHNSKVQIQRGDSIKFANTKDLNWDDIKQTTPKKRTSFNWKYITIPMAAALLGLIGYFAFNHFGAEEEIDVYEKYRKSIGLVYQEYYFAVVEASTKDTLMVLGKDDVEEYSKFNIRTTSLEPMRSTGSGFLISDVGEIITNRHVSTADKLGDEKKEFLESQMGLTLSVASGSYKQVDVVGLNKYIGFAPNETKLDCNKITDCLIEVNVVKEAYDPEVDLALMQIKTKTLPPDCTIVDVENDVIKSKDEIEVGSDAAIIGYPAGLTLGLSGGDEILQATYNEGVISKKTNKYKIQYDIASTGGASGSPVFDKKTAKLIAINYAGSTAAQGYNFGIIATHIDEVLD